MEISSMFEDYPDVVTPQQLQKMLGVGRTFVYKLLQNKVINSKKIGRLYKIPKKDVIEFINKK